MIGGGASLVGIDWLWDLNETTTVTHKVHKVKKNNCVACDQIDNHEPGHGHHHTRSHT